MQAGARVHTCMLKHSYSKHMPTHSHMCTHTLIYLHSCTYTHATYTGTHPCTHFNAYACTSPAHMQSQKHTCAHVYSCSTYTHTHTQLLSAHIPTLTHTHPWFKELTEAVPGQLHPITMRRTPGQRVREKDKGKGERWPTLIRGQQPPQVATVGTMETVQAEM